jgi:hypothetical protein
MGRFFRVTTRTGGEGCLFGYIGQNYGGIAGDRVTLTVKGAEYGVGRPINLARAKPV